MANGPILEVERICKYFGALAALKDVSFAVPEGRIYGFIGPNGSGKTTLFNVIAGTFPPSAGRVVAKGVDMTGRKAYEVVHAGIARTHQIVRPFRLMTVLENIQLAIHFGRRKVRSAARARDEAMQLLHTVGLERQADTLASAVSLGDQKKLELVRALATDPELLLCDEICGGLSPLETRRMLELLTDVRRRGMTIMYIEHNVKAIMSVCDHVVALNFGEKIAEGKPVEIQNNQAVIEAYLGKPGAAATPEMAEAAVGAG
jgi:branched-chain amino acid transport system ATP-binding protein